MKPYFAKCKTPCGCTEIGVLVVDGASYEAKCPVCGFLWDFTIIPEKEQSTIITENGIFQGTTDNLKLFGNRETKC